MPADFIQLAKGYRSLELLTDNCSLTVFSKGEHLGSPRVIDAYSQKVLELIGEGGRKSDSIASSIADFLEGKEYSRFEERVNPQGIPEIFELNDGKHAYHFLLKSRENNLIILEEMGFLRYKKLKNPHFDIASWIIKKGGRNGNILRKTIGERRIETLDGKAYHNCSIFKDLVSHLASRFGLESDDLEKVQRDFSVEPLHPLCVLTPSYS